MLRRCNVSQVVRRLTTTASCHRTPPQTLTTLFTGQVIPPPLKPFNQFLVYRSLSTASPNESEPPSSVEWVKRIIDHPVVELITIVVTLRFSSKLGKWILNKYQDNKNIKREENTEARYLKYNIRGFMGVAKNTITVEIANSRELVVFGYTTKSNGKPVGTVRRVILPNQDYSEAKKKAKFDPKGGIVVVEISDYKKLEDIEIRVEETKD